MKEELSRVLAASAAAALFTSAPCFAQDVSPEMLAGLPGVALDITVGDRAEECGLLESAVQNAAELELRRAGITILALERAFLLGGTLMVLVNVLPVTSQSGLLFSCVVDVELRLVQWVSLVRDEDIRGWITTWSVGTLGTITKERFPSAVRGVVIDNVSEFANEYLEANPRR